MKRRARPALGPSLAGLSDPLLLPGPRGGPGGPERSSWRKGTAKGAPAAAAAACTWRRGVSGAAGGGSSSGFRRKRRPSQVEPESERFRLAAAARPGPAQPSRAARGAFRRSPPLRLVIRQRRRRPKDVAEAAVAGTAAEGALSLSSASRPRDLPARQRPPDRPPPFPAPPRRRPPRPRPPPPGPRALEPRAGAERSP